MMANYKFTAVIGERFRLQSPGYWNISVKMLGANEVLISSFENYV